MKPDTILLNVLVDNSRFMRSKTVETKMLLQKIIADYRNNEPQQHITVTHSVFSDVMESVFVEKPPMIM